MRDKISHESEDREDLQLIGQIKKGDSKAFKSLVDKYQRPFYNLAFRILLDHDDAEDAFQDSIIKIYENIENFNDKYRFYSWASTIVVNTSINIRKANNTKIKLFNKTKERNSYNTGSNRIFENLVQKEKMEIAKSLLKELPFEYRIVLILRAYEELSYKEIAKRLNISVGTVMSRISRGRIKIQELLKKYNK